MPRKTTAEKLAANKLEQEQLKNEEKRLRQLHRKEEEKARTRRLIQRGAILESLIEGATDFTSDQIVEILKRTVGSSYGAKVVDEVKSPKTVVSAPRAEIETDES